MKIKISLVLISLIEQDMKIQSLIRDHYELVPVEVEISVVPGLPGIQFLGLPDQHLKESALRIKSAIRQAGFKFPRAQQILVNLRPSHLKKSSRGLELAVATAYLWQSEQVPKSLMKENAFIYGELSLNGDIHEPEDLHQDFLLEKASVLTGESPHSYKPRFHKWTIKNLKDLFQPSEISAEDNYSQIERPQEALFRNYSEEQARLLQIIATGEHSLLIAGAAGAGKSLLAQSVISFLSPPSSRDLFYSNHVHRAWKAELHWRPLIKPHHTTPVISMIGGGSIPFAGEVSRAHGGVLILDELLEFHPLVQEALREPLEEGKIHVARQGQHREYPARSIVIGTTNLCPCGDWVPLMAERPGCRFTARKCTSYSQRLSGPLTDRFEMLAFVQKLSAQSISGEEILRTVQNAQKWAKEQRGDKALPRHLSLTDLKAQCSRIVLKDFATQLWVSQRRQLSTLRVARSLADLAGSSGIEVEHYNEALPLTQHHFDKLKRGG